MNDLDVMSPVPVDQDEEPEIIGDTEQQTSPQPFDEIGESNEIEVSDGEQNHVQVEPEKVDPFTEFFEQNQNTYQSEVVVDTSGFEEIASQQVELLKGIYINQLFFIGCVGAVLVVSVLYSLLRKFF